MKYPLWVEPTPEMLEEQQKIKIARAVIQTLQGEALDRLRSAQDQFQLDKAIALVALVQWQIENFPNSVM